MSRERNRGQLPNEAFTLPSHLLASYPERHRKEQETWIDVTRSVWLVDPGVDENGRRTLRRLEINGEKLTMRLTQTHMDQLTEARLKHEALREGHDKH